MMKAFYASFVAFCLAWTSPCLAVTTSLDSRLYHPGFVLARQGQNYYVTQVLPGTLPETVPLSPGDLVQCPAPAPSDIMPCQGHPGRELAVLFKKEPEAPLETVRYSPPLLSLRQIYDRDSKLSSQKFVHQKRQVSYFRLWYIDSSTVSGHLGRELVRGGGSDATLLLDFQGLTFVESTAVEKLRDLLKGYATVILLGGDAPSDAVASAISGLLTEKNVQLALSERAKGGKSWSEAVLASAIRFEPVRLYRGKGDVAVRSLLGKLAD